MHTHQNDEPLPNRFSSIQSRAFRDTVSASGRQTITQCLLDAENDLKVYQAEINRLKAKIMVLEQRKDGLKETVRKYRTLLSPIHRVPQEVLAHTFSFCCQDLHFIAPNLLPATLTLSAVCGRWREVVIATPYLWSSISISVRPEDREEFEDGYSRKLKQLLELFMERSKNQPLDLDISDMVELFDHSEEATLGCVLSQSGRWRSVELDCNIYFYDHTATASLASSVFRRLQGRLPNLQHLALSHSFLDDQILSLIASNLNLFSECPSLVSLKIRAPLIPTNPGGFPWAQIQFLELSGCNSSHVVQILALSPNIKQFKLFHVHVISDQTALTAPATLSKLQHLSISTLDDCGSFFFQSFTLPALSSLDILDDYGDHVPRNTGALQSCLLRSSCPITKFTLAWLAFSKKEPLHHLLALMPNLVKLSITDKIWMELDGGSEQADAVTTEFLEQFVVNVGDERSTGFLPRLEDLNLMIRPLKSSGRQALQRALASRSNGMRVFSLCVFDVETKAEVSEYESLECFKDAGVRVNVSCRVKGGDS